MSALQTLYSHVISSKLPLAVPSQLSHVDQLGTGHGKVFIYSKKPRRFNPHAHQDLQFTSLSLSKLLDESSLEKLQVTAAVSREFETSEENPIKETVNISTSQACRKAVVDLGFDVGDLKSATISGDFGKVTNIQASVLHAIKHNQLRVKTHHPTVQEAIAKGGVLFVTTTVYEGERCRLHVTVGDSHKEVFSRDEPTALAFLLLKLSVSNSGLLQPKRNNGFLSVLETPSLSASDQLAPSTDPNELSLFANAVRNFHSYESLEEKGWIVVDVLSPGEAIPESSEELSTQPSEPQAPPQAESSTSPADAQEGAKVTTDTNQRVVEEVLVQQETVSLSSKPVAPVVEEVTVQESANVTSAPPVPIVEEVMVQESATVSSAPQGPEQSPGPQLDEHYLYSLKDFQPFESDTYNGIYTEVQEWVGPLVTNKALHSAYLSYVTPPHTVEKLQKLSQFLQEYGNTLRAHRPTPPVTYAPMEPVISALDSDWATQLDQVSSMIVVSEALAEFPQHIVKKAIELSQEKRTILVDFIRSTPYGVDKHVYTHEGPFGDPELQPFMTRMGFSLPPHSKNLVLDLGHEENEDRLAAGLILMLSTQQSQHV